MDGWAFWLLVFPVLLAVALYYLGFFTLGLTFFGSALKSGTPKRKLILMMLGVAIAAAPFIAIKVQKIQAAQEANIWQAQIAAFDRVDLKNRLPRKFVVVSGVPQVHVNFIKSKYGMTEFSKAENDRLKAAYINYRKAEFCHSHSSGKMMSKKIQIPICKDLPPSIHTVLNLSEPALFFAEGRHTSLRRSNKMVGKIYEIRLMTPREDLLVDYYEQRNFKSPAGVTNPYGVGRDLDKSDKPLHIKAFIEAALDGASR